VPIDGQLLQWVADVMGEQPVEVRGLRDGGSPWRLQLRERALVLRVGARGDSEAMRVEQLGQELVAARGFAVPQIIASDVDHDPPLLLMTAVRGASTIPMHRPTERLRTLGAACARLHAITVAAEDGLPRRGRPIAGVDFATLRAQQPSQPLLVRAEQVVRDYVPHGADGLVHGDFWQGNTVWDGDDLVAIIDWDCVGVGQAGVDLGSLRCDAAVCFGLPAAADPLAGWQTEAGRDADDVAYWDAVAALSTPPDMGWFAQAIGGQGRTDLTREVLVGRRDEFLAAALDAL
jgi:aminoglycoside phosphotransferase (APT) family kinase protein